MDACVSETYACEGGGQEHFRLGFPVVGVFDCAGKVFDCVAEGLEGEDIGDGVGALVCGTLDWVLRTGDAFVVGDCGPGFDAVAEDV